MRIRRSLAAPLVVVLLAGCTTQVPGELTTPDAATATPSASPGPTASARLASTTVITTGLDAPWSMVRLDDGSTLISERDGQR